MAVNVNVNFWGTMSCSLIKGANSSDELLSAFSL